MFSSIHSLFLVAVILRGVSSFSPHLLIPTTTTTSYHFSRDVVKITTTSLNSIVSEVTNEMKTAMKAKDTVTLGVIRLMRSSFSNAQIELQVDGDLSNEQAQNVLRKMAKMRQESIDMYIEGGAVDRADEERFELAIIERWLPKLADEAKTRVWVQEAIGVVGGEHMGKVMGQLMKEHKAELDGKLTQQIVKEELAK